MASDGRRRQENVAQLFSKKRCLVTGGAGFIGSHLVKRLVEFGAEVHVIDTLHRDYGGNRYNLESVRADITFQQADIRNQQEVEKAVEGCDFLFNLAGQTSHLDSMADPKTDLEINYGAQLTLLEAVRSRNPSTMIVFASTRQIYGRPLYLPVDESHPLDPVDVNGINKLAGEMAHLLYADVYGLKVSALRLTNTYGPGMRVKDARQTFLGVWLKQALEGEEILVFGDGSQLRDFTYVDDVVDAFLAAATQPEAQGKAINLGGLETISLGEVASLLCGLAPQAKFRNVEFPADRKAIDIGDFYADWRLAQKVLHWSPLVDLRDGLQKSLLYYNENRSFYW